MKGKEWTMFNLLVFAGTTEGRELLETLSWGIGDREITVHACVATDYGKEVLPENLAHIALHTGRMSEEDMFLLMEAQKFDCVIDTTHPYATLVSEHIRSACRRSGSSYLRLLRPRGVSAQWTHGEGVTQSPDGTCLLFADHRSAAEYLNETKGNVLMTIGSKALAEYTRIRDYQHRLFPRVLPMEEVIGSCQALGFAGKQLICMQGPFSQDLNMAIMKQIGAAYMVTKDSGDAGGFQEKWRAAQAAGAKLLVVGREHQEEGLTFAEVLPYLEHLLQLPKETLTLSQRKGSISSTVMERTEAAGSVAADAQAAVLDQGRWFPFFLNISGKRFLVIGGGKIARRRILTLLQFDCSITVVAKEILDVITEKAEDPLQMTVQLKAFAPEDLENADYVLAATNNKAVNQEIWRLCKEKNIPVNVADDREKCDFYFPGIVREQGVTAGVTAEGKNHRLAKMATGAIRQTLQRLEKEGE